jgi:flagellar basal body rod protein FlgC
MEAHRDVLDLECDEIANVRCKGQNGEWPYRPVNVTVLVREAAKKWKTGNFDTADIAHILKVHESEIWIRMDRIRKGR